MEMFDYDRLADRSADVFYSSLLCLRLIVELYLNPPSDTPWTLPLCYPVPDYPNDILILFNTPLYIYRDFTYIYCYYIYLHRCIFTYIPLH